MNPKDMTYDELFALLAEKRSAIRELRSELRAATVVFDMRRKEMKERERLAAAGNPDAVSAKVIGVSAEMTAGGRAP